MLVTVPAVTRVKTPVWRCVCQRCGHAWISVGAKPPKFCTFCGSPYWQTKPRPYRKTKS